MLTEFDKDSSGFECPLSMRWRFLNEGRPKRLAPTPSPKHSDTHTKTITGLHMDRDDKIVAVGLLTQSDLERLGRGFSRAFPVENEAAFDDLLAKLEAVEWKPKGPSQ